MGVPYISSVKDTARFETKIVILFSSLTHHTVPIYSWEKLKKNAKKRCRFLCGGDGATINEYTVYVMYLMIQIMFCAVQRLFYFLYQIFVFSSSVSSVEHLQAVLQSRSWYLPFRIRLATADSWTEAAFYLHNAPRSEIKKSQSGNNWQSILQYASFVLMIWLNVRSSTTNGCKTIAAPSNHK